MKPLTYSILAFLLILSSKISAQNISAELLKDINQQPTVFTNIGSFGTTNGIAYFTNCENTTSNYGSILLRTDGNAEGTYPTTINADCGGDIMSYKGAIYFISDDPLDNLQKLLKYDGIHSPALVSDLDTACGYLSFVGIFKDKMLFAMKNCSPEQLWLSDGTSSGTRKMADVDVTTEDKYAIVNDILYFHGTNNNKGGVWRTDGTPVGTYLLLNYCANCDLEGPKYFTSCNNELYFSVIDAHYPEDELYVSDGTVEGTHEISEEVHHPTYLKALHGKVFFFSRRGFQDELWSTDGTDKGTVQITHIAPKRAAEALNSLTEFNGLLYFTYNEFPGPGTSIWKSDGTAAGTMQIAADSELLKTTNVTNLQVINGSIYAVANYADKSYYVGFGLLKINSDACHIIHRFGNSLITPFYSYGDNILFEAADSNKLDQLWKSDGTTQGTKEVGTNVASNGSSLYPNYYYTHIHQVIGSTLYIGADDGIHGKEMWKTNGSGLGTKILRDESQINYFPLYDEVEISSAFNFQDKLIYTMYHYQNQDIYRHYDGYPLPDHTYLLSSDGSAKGTKKFYELDGDLDLKPVTLGSLFYFIRLNSIWQSDGTNEGTKQTVNLNYNSLKYLTVCNDKLIFQYYSPFYGYELYGMDGANGNVALVYNINPGTESSYPNSFYTVHGFTYFMATVGNALQLWKTDGTSSYTYALATLSENASSCSGDQAAMIELKKRIVVLESDFNNGNSLWITDGSQEGTVLLYQFHSGDCPSPICEVNGLVYFVGNDKKYDSQVWRTDGTAEGTYRVSDLTPKPNEYLQIHDFYPYRDKLLFSIEDSTSDYHIYISDGTTKGTMLLPVYYNDEPLNANILDILNNEVILVGYTDNTGWELFKLDLSKYLETGNQDAFKIQNSDNSIVINPNPSSGAFHLQLQDGDVQVIIYDVTGQQMDALLSKGNEITFGEHYQAGIYFVKIISESGKMDVVKVVRQ